MEEKVAKKNGLRSGHDHSSPFELIKRTNNAGGEYWSSRDFAEVLGYGDYRNFEAVIAHVSYIHQHSHRNEENTDKAVFERQNFGGRLMRIFGFRYDEPAQKGAKRKRKTEVGCQKGDSQTEEYDRRNK